MLHGKEELHSEYMDMVIYTITTYIVLHRGPVLEESKKRINSG